MQLFRPIRRAILSVSDKKEIVNFAKELSKRGVDLISTNKTADLLIQSNIKVIKISEYTNFPEIMDGRIKTLHLKLHGGILGRRGVDDDIMKLYNIPTIDIVIVNLYPFKKIIKKQNCTIEDAFTNIDIGGNTMIRAAAKNYRDITIVTDKQDYESIIKEMDINKNSLSLSTRFNLAIKAFEYSAEYDSSIANYLGKFFNNHNNTKNKKSIINFPHTLNLNFIKKQDLRYGENYHQKASFYTKKKQKENSISTFKQIHGKTLSYNNILDANTAIECVRTFDKPACVIVKHSNPCGVSISNNIKKSYINAFKCDPISAFGGIIAFNRKLDKITLETIINNQFVEVIIAPYIDNDISQILIKKQNIRLLTCGNLNKPISNFDFKSVNGGLLVQNSDIDIIKNENFFIVTKRYPTENELNDANLSWKVAKFVKSNAIVYAKNNMTIGIGAGQMSRVYSAKIANLKAIDSNLKTNGCTMASDAFLPFCDSIKIAADIGVTCIIQPGGSIRDIDTINIANKYNIAMIFTKIRHLKH
ncbi:bifunctional phosphoribosylaminoimidazolecarboxamide formyltransferase/IMP cyclohydrolase [Candidatus Providencia siddallii]|uniref:Bifunctional purine biosynthesis protein PurH n=1 Tax=Candidatus Providencia siddallii TaxID=1715285 RepID=A0ABM9NNA4_9GAMM